MKITKLEVILLGVGIRFARTNARGVITKPGTPSKIVLLKLHTDEGVTGTGSVRPNQPTQPENPQSTIAAIKDYFGPAILGEDPFDIEKILAKCDRLLPGNSFPKMAIDLALHDVMGKAMGVPVYKLLGGLYWDSIPLEWSLGMNPTDEMVREATGAVEKYGVKYVCVKVAGPAGWKQDVKNVAAVRAALGDGIALGIDANELYSPAVAVKAIRKMEEYDLYYVEQPVPRWDLAGMARVRHAVETPIMADEGVFTLQEAVGNIQAGAVDILCLKLPKHGGLHRAKKIAAVGEAFHVPVNLGAYGDSGVGAAAAAHFYASTRNMFPAAEFIGDLANLEHDLLTEETKFVIKDGSTVVPKRPGLGVEVDEKAVAKYTLDKWVVE
ncbi:MAG: hypothetical protein HY673_00310 [Chloroflexi bacterium]|nr:hypothetical protein [Chloroflexota bacterium]